MHVKFLVSFLPLASTVSALPQAGQSNSPKPPAPYRPNRQRAEAVKEAFIFSWDGYYKYAFPHDELHPISNSGGDSRNGWGASAIDAMSTAIVMGAGDVVGQILDYVPKINFDKPQGSVSLFETTIRYLGGFLSAYDFIGPQGPLRALVKPDKYKNVDALLSQAKHLADNMKYAFNTKSGVPHNELFFPKDSDGASTNGLATVGTLVLEWMRLSDLTGDRIYGQLADRAEQYLLKPLPRQNEPFPGLIGSDINIEDGTLANNHGSWSGGADSFYEYLIKMWVYDPSRFGLYKDRWELAAQSSIKYLASHPKPELTFLAQFDGPNKLQLYSQHLTCFDGGNFLLGGTVLGKQEYIDFGLKLVDSCHKTYTATVTGIGPEAFSWDAERCPPDQKAFFTKNGFWITAPNYILRPEVIESIYYAYRTTGDPKYQEWIWDAFVHINTTSRAVSGFAELSNVNADKGGEKGDNQESFWFAEVMKYSYLTFAEDSPWQVSGPGRPQEWVFNTEAHPFKVMRRR